MTSSGIEIGLMRNGLWVEIFGNGSDEQFPTVIPYSKRIEPDKLAITRMKKILGFTEKKVRELGGRLTIVLPDHNANDLEWLMCILHQEEFTPQEQELILSFVGSRETSQGFIRGLVR